MTLDQEIESKLREIQGQLISTSSKYYSFSKIVNMMLLIGMMSSERLDYKQWNLLKDLLSKKQMRLDEIQCRVLVEEMTEKFI
jgi:hypothetical protein